MYHASVAVHPCSPPIVTGRDCLQVFVVRQPQCLAAKQIFVHRLCHLLTELLIERVKCCAAFNWVNV